MTSITPPDPAFDPPEASDGSWRTGLRGQPGLGIVRASVTGTAVFVVVAVLATVFTESLGLLVAIVSGVLFAGGSGAFLWAYAIAVARSRTDLIGVGGLFFLAGCAPSAVRRVMMTSLGLQVVVALVTASMRFYTELAFGTLVPMWGLGLAGLWGARYGVFPARLVGAEAPAGSEERDRDGAAGEPDPPRDAT